MVPVVWRLRTERSDPFQEKKGKYLTIPVRAISLLAALGKQVVIVD